MKSNPPTSREYMLTMTTSDCSRGSRLMASVPSSADDTSTPINFTTSKYLFR
jgi:hypothetical protein